MQNLPGLLDRADRATCRAVQADPRHRLAELLAILRLGDGRGVGADHLDAALLEHAGLVQFHGGIQRRLSAHRRQQCIGTFASDDLLHGAGGDRLDVGCVGHARIGHDGRRVRVDQHHPVALFFERLARLRARVVEFAGLANHDWPGADNQN